MGRPLAYAINRSPVAALLPMLVPVTLLSAAASPMPVAPQNPQLETPRPRPLRIAVIGDYGKAGTAEQDVAALVHSWNPEFVLTTGDNNYPNGEAATIDANIGAYYHDFIAPYAGAYGSGAPDRNRFFPALGNHDWIAPGAQPYLDYFTLPGNERYYELRWDPVHVFVLDSDSHEPAGVTSGSAQGQWLQAALAASNAPFKLVTAHHPPHSSGEHGSSGFMQWPFSAWGASAVLCGHDHLYERLQIGGAPYFVNGLGGASLYQFEGQEAGSEVRYRADYGAMLVEATPRLACFQFISRAGNVVDTFSLPAGGIPVPVRDLLPRGADWRYLDDGSDPGAAWFTAGFDDSAWASGSAQLGYGDGDESTVVGYGPNASAKYITTYFRTTVSVPDPGLFRGLYLRLLRDDGAVVYLNGAEVWRSNMPAGAITSTTLASSALSGSREATFFGLDLDPALLSAGDNLLAVEIHQADPTSSDISFDLELSGVERGDLLVQRGSIWRYLDDGSDAGAAWRRPDFNDAAWHEGPAQLGYGDGDESTIVSYGPNASAKYITTYFRHSFTLADPTAVHGLLLHLLRDDGAAVYMNGVEVYRGNLPFGSLGSASVAPDTVSGSAESDFILTSVDPQLLLAGANVLAVEVHQDSPTSSDLSFDLELEAY
ncbi:MAG: hypothetical protein EYC70_10380 [Planctomycetota bacterium]|nr:MAG: hypothetical protein EYC70_10380 [Planctomycetota bacterium]